MHIVLSSSPYNQRINSSKALGSFTVALEELVKGCESLETLTVGVKCQKLSYGGYHTTEVDVVTLGLGTHPLYLRDDVVRSWALTRLRESIEYGSICRELLEAD
jgi:hypothetical protein